MFLEHRDEPHRARRAVPHFQIPPVTVASADDHPSSLPECALEDCGPLLTGTPHFTPQRERYAAGEFVSRQRAPSPGNQTEPEAPGEPCERLEEMEQKHERALLERRMRPLRPRSGPGGGFGDAQVRPEADHPRRRGKERHGREEGGPEEAEKRESPARQKDEIPFGHEREPGKP